MLFMADIGNSSISIGISERYECKLLCSFKIASDIHKTSDEYAVIIKNLLDFNSINLQSINGSIVASVVPQLTKVISDTVKKLTNKTPMVVGPGIKTGFPIKLDDPSDLGADIVCNVSAVINILKKQNKPSGASVVVDMGTATTICAINKSYEYIGGCIIPGVKLSFDVLHSKTALLPGVTLSAPKRAIGKNSEDSVRSGIIWGNALMIDGFIEKFEKEMKVDCIDSVYITGGLANIIIPACDHHMIYEPNLTLLGLYYIYRNNMSDT